MTATISVSFLSNLISRHEDIYLSFLPSALSYSDNFSVAMSKMSST